MEFKSRIIDLDGLRIKVQVWDYPKQRNPNLYRGAHGIFVVYDVSDRGDAMFQFIFGDFRPNSASFRFPFRLLCGFFAICAAILHFEFSLILHVPRIVQRGQEVAAGGAPPRTE
jgi:hypothetical protein